MTTNTVYDLLCIGNYTKDTIITPAGTQYVDGGAVRYAAHAAARLGVKTAVVTRLAEEDSRVVDMFKQSGIDCFPVFTPHSTLMKLDYPAQLWMEKEIKSVANVTRADVREFLQVAADANIKPEYQEYELKDANQALIEMKQGKIRGSKVLRM